LEGIDVRSYFDVAKWPPDPDVDATHAAWSLRDIARDPRGFDVVHLHSCAAVELSRLCPYPPVATIHHDCDSKLSRMYAANPNVKLVAISESQARREVAPVTAIVHHGLSLDRFPFLPDQGYLLYLGRYSREKGPHLAVEIATRRSVSPTELANVRLLGLQHVAHDLVAVTPATTRSLLKLDADRLLGRGVERRPCRFQERPLAPQLPGVERAVVRRRRRGRHTEVGAAAALEALDDLKLLRAAGLAEPDAGALRDRGVAFRVVDERLQCLVVGAA
jgi:hypothetical protein